ncbi:MAG: hypothetical protein IK142_07945 [Clostridiales bacterium]|nr:hypothetical protein [Clostridiales bacterium]
MFTSDRIIGIDKLRSSIPAELQSWSVFCNIIELHYYGDINEFGQDVKCLKLVLSDAESRFRIELDLNNVHGEVRFDTCNGFCSGFQIDDLSDSGCEKANTFHLHSYEMDIEPDFYCESIKVSML